MSPWLHVKISSLDPSYDVLSFLNQVRFLALKSLRVTVKKGFLKLISPRFNSKFFMKVSKLSWVWVGDL